MPDGISVKRGSQKPVCRPRLRLPGDSPAEGWPGRPHSRDHHLSTLNQTEAAKRMSLGQLDLSRLPVSQCVRRAEAHAYQAWLRRGYPHRSFSDNLVHGLPPSMA